MLWFQRKKPAVEWDTRIYAGLPGSGKTLFMVRDCIQLLRQGVRVYANMKIRDPLTGRESLPLCGWLDMLRASVLCLEDNIPTVFAFDEIHLAADARQWASTPVWWLNLMAQRRHFGVGLIGTTQDPGQVEKRLRLLIGRVVSVRPSALRRLWGRLPLFSVQEVDMALIDVPEADSGSGAWFFTWVKADAFHGYSTRELMASLDFAELKDEEAKAEVRLLTERAIMLAGVDILPSFADCGICAAAEGATAADSSGRGAECDT